MGGSQWNGPSLITARHILLFIKQASLKQTFGGSLLDENIILGYFQKKCLASIYNTCELFDESFDGVL